MRNPAPFERSLVGAVLLDPTEALLLIDRAGGLPQMTDPDAAAVARYVATERTAGRPVSAESAMTGCGLPGATWQSLADAAPLPGAVAALVRTIRELHATRHAVAILERDDAALDFKRAELARILDPITQAGNEGKGFTVRTWGEVVDMTLTVKRMIYARLFACGQLQTIFGQGGLGKSRIGTNLARNQVLGVPFLGVETETEPLRHLFIGSENDAHRWQVDARCMSKGLRAADVALLGEHIRMTTLEGAEDTFINLGDPRNVAKWRATLRAWPCDVLWVDPWGDVLEGDGFDRDVRSTLATLRKLAREVNPDCGIVVLAHARTGSANIAQAGGFDAANFGKDSKALFSCSRAVVNVAPFDASESPDLCWIPAKCNDGRRPEPLRIRLDPETLTYHAVESLDVESWQRSVKEAAKSTWQKTSVKFDAGEVLKLIDAPLSKLELHAAVRALGITERDARAGLESMLRTGRLIERKAGLRNSKLIGTPQCFQT
jgi:hypothetical protein